MNTSEKVDTIRFVSECGTEQWVTPDGYLHREDGPAMIAESGERAWFLNGKHHRVDGPAVIYSNGKVEYWIEDIQYDSVTFLIKSYEYTNKI